MTGTDDAQIIEAIEADLQDRLAQVGEYLSRKVFDAAPKDTLRLAKSIRYVIDRETLTVKIVVDEFYSAFLEFGTKHKPAKPFLAVTVDAEIQAVIAIMEGSSN